MSGTALGAWEPQLQASAGLAFKATAKTVAATKAVFTLEPHFTRNESTPDSA